MWYFLWIPFEVTDVASEWQDARVVTSRWLLQLIRRPILNRYSDVVLNCIITLLLLLCVCYFIYFINFITECETHDVTDTDLRHCIFILTWFCNVHWLLTSILKQYSFGGMGCVELWTVQYGLCTQSINYFSRADGEVWCIYIHLFKLHVFTRMSVLCGLYWLYWLDYK